MPWSQEVRDERKMHEADAQRMKALGMSQVAIAEHFGISKYTVMDWLRAAVEPEFEVRRCTHEGCGTLLCSYNDGPRCWFHAGWDEAALIEAGDPQDFERVFYWIANDWAIHRADLQLVT